MSYLDELRKEIKQLEDKIRNDESKKLELEILLNKLRLAEFEEDIKESREQKLLKG